MWLSSNEPPGINRSSSPTEEGIQTNPSDGRLWETFCLCGTQPKTNCWECKAKILGISWRQLRHGNRKNLIKLNNLMKAAWYDLPLRVIPLLGQMLKLRKLLLSLSPTFGLISPRLLHSGSLPKACQPCSFQWLSISTSCLRIGWGARAKPVNPTGSERTDTDPTFWMGCDENAIESGPSVLLASVSTAKQETMMFREILPHQDDD